MHLHTFAIGTDWSLSEKRLLAMAPNPEAQKPVNDSNKQEQAPQVPYIPLKGENPQKFAEFIINAPQYLQSVKNSENWREKVREMEQWLYSTNAGGKDRDGQNEHIKQRNIWLKQNGAPYTISQKLDANDPHERDFIKINFPENKESPQLVALKQRRAALRQQIKAVDSRIKQTEFRGNRSRTPRYDSMHTQEDMQELKRLKVELAIVEQQIANPQKAPPAAPVMAGAMPSRPRFGSQQAPESRFDLDATLQRIQPPEVAQKIQQMPQQMQASVVRIYESMNGNDLPVLQSLVIKLGNNPKMWLMPFFNQNMTLRTPEEISKMTAVNEQNKKYIQEGAEFLRSLSPQERQMFEQIAGESRIMQQQGEVLTEANLRQIQNLIKKYNEAKTDNDKMLAEGQMRMMGVDVDATNFDQNNVRMLAGDGMTRFMSMLVGLLQVVSALAGKAGIGDKEGNVIRKTKEAAKEKSDVEKMTPEERVKEKKKLEKDIGESRKTEKVLQDKIGELKISIMKDPSQPKIEELHEELAKMEKELKSLTEARQVLEKKLEEIKKVESAPKKEKGRDKKTAVSTWKVLGLEKAYSMDVGLLCVKLEHGNITGGGFERGLREINTEFGQLSDVEKNTLLQLQLPEGNLKQGIVIHDKIYNEDYRLFFDETKREIDFKKENPLTAIPQKKKTL